MRIYLNPTLLSSASLTNNLGWFTSAYNYISKDDGSGTVYPLPVSGPIGYTLAGQDIFPVYNNRGTLTPEQCEADACNQHVGQGGGQPHLHGDPFGSTCFYSAANYSSLAAHPPLIGYAIDGFGIYGRHLSASAPGYSDTLDICGGHSHGSYDYHYHTQVVNATTDTIGAVGVSSGLSFPVGTSGVYQCFRGSLSADPYLHVNYNVPDAACCGSTAAYVKAGYTFNPAAKGPGGSTTTTTVTNAVAFNSLPSTAVNAISGTLTTAAQGVLLGALRTAVTSVCAACTVTLKKVVDSSSGKTLFEARRLQTTYGVTVTFVTSGSSATQLAAVTTAASTSTSTFLTSATAAVAANAGYASVTVAVAPTSTTTSASSTNQSVAIGVGVGVGVGGAIAILATLWYFGFFTKAAAKTVDALSA